MIPQQPSDGARKDLTQFSTREAKEFLRTSSALASETSRKVASHVRGSKAGFGALAYAAEGSGRQRGGHFHL